MQVLTKHHFFLHLQILDKEKIAKQNMGTQIKKEISIMKSVTHPNVVAIHEVFATSTKIFIVLELVDGGELFEYLLDRKRLPETEARHFLQQLVEGLSYCHSKGIFHRDLKPENLLLDLQGNIKISDFGLSTLYVGSAEGQGDAAGAPEQDRMELLHTTCGTPNYVAPEVLENRGYDGRQADVWSVGIILFVLVAGYLPFEEDTMPGLFDKIKRAEFVMPECSDGSFNPNSPGRKNPYARARSSSIHHENVQFSRDLITLLQNILVADPKQRWTLQQVKNCEWMRGPAVPPAYVNNRAQAAGLPRSSQDNSVKTSGKGEGEDGGEEVADENAEPNSQRPQRVAPVQRDSRNPLHKVVEPSVTAPMEPATLESEILPPTSGSVAPPLPSQAFVHIESAPKVSTLEDESHGVIVQTKTSLKKKIEVVKPLHVEVDVSPTPTPVPSPSPKTRCCIIA
jgi:serine/threonine protein kinase